LSVDFVFLTQTALKHKYAGQIKLNANFVEFKALGTHVSYA